MKKQICLSLSVWAFAAFAAPVLPEPNHPIIGKWQWTRAVNHCTEIYDFRPDGTVPVVSGAERTDSTYVVAAYPDMNGFYEKKMTIVKDYGGKDCADDESESSGESTSYIFFNPEQTKYFSCMEPKLEKCFGPLKKITDE